MKLKTTKLISVFLLTLLIILNIKSSFATAIISKSMDMNEVGPVQLQYDNTVAITGDSYAGIFCKFEDMKDFFIIQYARAGQTVVQNEAIMTEAALSDCKVMIVSIGVNDHMKGTVPYIFEATLRRILNAAMYTNKVVFMHTYCKYPIWQQLEGKYKISMYNDIIKRLCNEYNRTYFIDMSEYEGSEYILSDNIHYGQEFYDILYNKIIRILGTIDF